MYFFTSDEHYGHKNIIKYCNRPFNSVEEMDQELIRRHNLLVSSEDVVIHAGDFTLKKKQKAHDYISCLNGKHIFLRGSHDAWLGTVGNTHEIWEQTIQEQHIVVCHYAMRVWSRSHYNSWQLFGHSHGTLKPIGKQLDIGVDCHDFYPLSFDQVLKIMKSRPDNPNKGGRMKVD